MKADTVAVLLKGVGFIGGALFLQLTSSLAQWANSNTWPDRINWIVIVFAAAGQACTAMVTFASGSWAAWRDSRMNANGVAATPEAQPVAAVKTP